MKDSHAVWRTAAVGQWLLVWILMVTLGFVGLRLTSAASSAGAVQYLSFLGRILRGDLGVSAHDGQAVIAMAVAGLPVDLLLTGGALLAAWLIGSGWGLLAAVRADGAVATWLMGLARGFVAVSVMVLVPVVVLSLSATQRWSMLEGGVSLWLPMLALALPYAAQIARSTQRDALASLASEPVFMARAKGLSRLRIWARYVLPVTWSFTTPSRLPLASVLTSVIIIEHLLGTAGTGRFFVTAARQQDYAVVAGLGIVYCTLLIVVNLVIDLVRGRQAGSPLSPSSPMTPAREVA